jgi:hypothetical protein
VSRAGTNALFKTLAESAHAGQSKRDFCVSPHAAHWTTCLFGVNEIADDECNRLWVLKNSFRGISRTKFTRKLLNLRLPQALEFTRITALVPFSTATPGYANYLPN